MMTRAFCLQQKKMNVGLNFSRNHEWVRLQNLIKVAGTYQGISSFYAYPCYICIRIWIFSRHPLHKRIYRLISIAIEQQVRHIQQQIIFPPIHFFLATYQLPTHRRRPIQAPISKIHLPITFYRHFIFLFPVCPSITLCILDTYRLCSYHHCFLIHPNRYEYYRKYRWIQ